MPTEKQNALILPENVQISITDRGIEIVNDGDIIIRAKFPNASIRSLNGDVHIFSSGEKQTFANIEAPKGLVKILGEDFEIAEIRAKEVFADVRFLQTKSIRLDGEITFNRGKLQVNAISAYSLHFSGTDFNGQHVGVQEDAHFSGDNAQVQVVTGTHVDFQLRGLVKVGKLTAHAEAYLSAKQVDIDYLSAKNLRVTPQTQGVIVCLDGTAPSEPNSIVGMLSPITFLEKIPALTGLIREFQSSPQEEKLLSSANVVGNISIASINGDNPNVIEVKSSVSEMKSNVTEIKTSEAAVEIQEQAKSAMLEKPPEFYRTSAEIPIPYKELAAKQNIKQVLENKVVETEEDKTIGIATPAFEPDLSPSGPIFEPDLASSTPLFELPSITSLIEPVFEPNKDEPLTFDPETNSETNSETKQGVDEQVKQKTKEEDTNLIFDNNLPPLELPPLEEDPITGNTGPLNLTNSGPIDLGLDIDKSK
ncbi:MAG: hypothetical protein HY819_11480 [Acidobacteria bacterium]|nr:hypothetical protein [Acidobacteriota bacterium]